MNVSLRRSACLVSSILIVCAGLASAELEAWDAAKVKDLAKQLVPATQTLYDTFYKQVPPLAGSGQTRDYARLKLVIRHLKSEAKELSGSLDKGEGYDETLPIYESLMEDVRDAQEIGARIFATEDLKQKAAAARGLLNELGPYYDAEFKTLQPVTR
jgi:hypothetical protein